MENGDVPIVKLFVCLPEASTLRLFSPDPGTATPHTGLQSSGRGPAFLPPKQLSAGAKLGGTFL